MDEILRPKSISLNNITYYNADDLRNYDSAYFHGCSRTVRDIIKKRSIDSDQYMYATWGKKNGWTLSSNQSKPSNKAKLLLLEEWVKQNIPKMKPESEETKEAEYEYPELPALLYLENEEKFKDENGEVVEIETRGERTSTGVYFLAKDVSIAFEMPNLNKTLLDTRWEYNRDEHYKTFIDTNRDILNFHMNKKQLYITYKGMLKILFSSRSGKANSFVDWATETLFTAQMGTTGQREELVSGIIGIPAKSLRQVLKTSTTATPCIYRFALGTAKELRDKMNLSEDIKDDYIIIKYGYTDDLVRRTSEHMKTYKSILPRDLELMNYVYIDPKFLSQAEVDIKEFFSDIEIHVKYESFVELVAINPKHEKIIKKQFKYMHTEYAGAVKDLIDQIAELKRQMQIDNERHQWELKDKDRIIENQKTIIEKKDVENELVLLKLQIAEKNTEINL